MPELPEVETVARGLKRALLHATLTGVETRRADLRFPLPPGMAQRLSGRTVIDIGRRAKYIVIGFDDDISLLCHLGMTGRFTIHQTPPAPLAHDHVVFTTRDGLTVVYNDARRFGMMDMVDTPSLPTHRFLSHLGMEPLSSAFTGARLHRLAAGRRTTIKAALLDQRLVVGVGNIYASEALFNAGISPLRVAASLARAECQSLAEAIKQVLRRAIQAGGSSLRDYKQADGELGYFQHHWAVYDRAGKSCPDCRCTVQKTGGIQRVVQAGRSSFFCPQKQI